MVRVTYSNGKTSEGTMTHHDSKRGIGRGFVSRETQEHERKMHNPHKPDFQKFKSATHSARDVVKDEVAAEEPFNNSFGYGR